MTSSKPAKSGGGKQKKKMFKSLRSKCSEQILENAAYIPLALTGRDICGSAITGSGKGVLNIDGIIEKQKSFRLAMKRQVSFGGGGSEFMKYLDIDSASIVDAKHGHIGLLISRG